MRGAPPAEQYGRHSDLCIMGMYYAQHTGADMWAYHDLMFHAGVGQQVDIEDARALASYAGGLLDHGAFYAAITAGKYQQAVLDGNDYAYEKSDVWYLPVFRSGQTRLDAAGGVGVSKQQLQAFLDGLA